MEVAASHLWKLERKTTGSAGFDGTTPEDGQIRSISPLYGISRCWRRRWRIHSRAGDSQIRLPCSPPAPWGKGRGARQHGGGKSGRAGAAMTRWRLVGERGLHGPGATRQCSTGGRGVAGGEGGGKGEEEEWGKETEAMAVACGEEEAVAVACGEEEAVCGKDKATAVACGDGERHGIEITGVKCVRRVGPPVGSKLT